MRVLPSVAPTPEQLKIVSRTTAGIEVIRGAAGSGKTTTAILRLRGLTGLFLNRRKSTNSFKPVRTLIITFNRTLRGYVEELAHQQAATGEQVELAVDTFGHWAYELLNHPQIADEDVRRARIKALGSTIPLEGDFLCKEVDYISGLYLPSSRHEYIGAKREGRGVAPRVDKDLRQRILTEVMPPYAAWKKQNGVLDWSDLEIALATKVVGIPYDIVIVDETQDFSANQVRALLNHTAQECAVTFILDSAQRIYARAFSWGDVGIKLTPTNSHRLELNYRNTAEIAAFAAPLLEDITAGDLDATIPNLKACHRHGPPPVVLVGRFSQQIARALTFIKQHVDLTKESVAFLHPKGGGWFDTTRSALRNAGLAFVEITRNKNWPGGEENIALSTINSAKGLEFDHVFILGLSAKLLPHGQEAGDDELNQLRRLLAMGITRAKNTITVGYKDEERSDLMDLLKIGTYREIRV